jgi:hypothetical protein
MELSDVFALCVLRVNRRRDVMILFLCTEGEHVERCDVTALFVLRVNRPSDVMIKLCVY